MKLASRFICCCLLLAGGSTFSGEFPPAAPSATSGNAVTPPPDWFPPNTVVMVPGDQLIGEGYTYLANVVLTDVFRLQGKGDIEVLTYPQNVNHQMEVRVSLQRLNFRGEPVTIAQQTDVCTFQDPAFFNAPVTGRLQDIRLAVEAKFLTGPTGTGPGSQPAYYDLKVFYNQPRKPLTTYDQVVTTLTDAATDLQELTHSAIDRLPIPRPSLR